MRFLRFVEESIDGIHWGFPGPHRATGADDATLPASALSAHFIGKLGDQAVQVMPGKRHPAEPPADLTGSCSQQLNNIFLWK